MAYTPPVGNVVVIDLTGAYTPPAGGGVILDLGAEGLVYPQIDISGAWKTITELKLDISGSWKEITEIKIAAGGIWKDLIS